MTTTKINVQQRAGIRQVDGLAFGPVAVVSTGRGRHYIVHVETGYQLGAAISNWRLALKLARRIAEPSNAEYFYGLEANKLTNRHKSASKVFSRLVDEIFGK